MASMPDRIPLAMLPTPLERADRLSEAWGGPTIWVKRDDLTGFGLSGNKVRKLEFHLAAARAVGAVTVITCGALQSNHCRATALAAARLGMRCELFLRSPHGAPPDASTGNHLLARLAGASITYITPSEYERRDELMADRASGGRAWVIPEGASDALGMWGFTTATQELADQLPMIPSSKITIWHAASSGGSTAGIVWAADRMGLAADIVACSIGETGDRFLLRLASIWDEAVDRWGGRTPDVGFEFVDDHIGGGYGVVSEEQLAAQAEATALTGLLFDPTYTGKALVALRSEVRSGRFAPGEHVVFWHTGGGFAVFSHDYDQALS